MDISKLEKIVRDICDDIFSIDTQKTINSKADGSLVTNVDLALQKELIDKITQQWPYPVLAEEMESEVQSELLSVDHDALWVIDPLDGTTNFANNIPYYAVSVALQKRGAVILGLVYDPCRKECFTAVKGEGAWLNQNRLNVSRHASVKINEAVANIDFKRLPENLATKIVTEQPFRSIRSEGSVALDFCWLAVNRFQVYIHGGSRLWDYAAGRLIAEEAGCKVNMIDSAKERLGTHFFAATSSVANIDIVDYVKDIE